MWVVFNWADADAVADATSRYNDLSDDEKAQIPAELTDQLAAAQKQADAVNKKNGASSVTGDLPWNIRLMIAPIDSSDASYAAFLDLLGGKKLVQLADVYLFDTLSQTKYELPAGQSVTLTLGGLSLAGATGVVVAHQKEDGTLEYLDATVSDTAVTFTASSFSLYGVAAQTISTPGSGSPGSTTTTSTTGSGLAKTGDAGVNMFTALLFCGIAGAALVLYWSRRRRA